MINEGRTEVDMKMSSQDLQKAFSSVYKNFFNTHDIVLSGNAILTWWADISHGISSLRIKQKLPIKTFCAGNPNNSGKVTFGRIEHYSILENAFREDEFSVFFKQDTLRIASFLENFLMEHGFSWWLDIGFLTEAPRGHGFAFSGVVSVLLAYLLYTTIGKLDPKVLSDRELPLDHPLLDELYHFSLRISKCISESIGASNNYAAMLPATPMPIAYLSQRNGGESESSSLEGITHKGTLVNFLWIEDPNLDLPLDYGVIFSGMEYRFSEIESTRELTKRQNHRLDSFVARTIESLPLSEEDKSVFSGLLDCDKNRECHIDGTNFRILEGFDYLLRNNYSDSGVNAFIDTVKSIGLTSFSYQKENRLFFALQYLFYKYRQFEDEEMGIIPFNSGKIGGSLLFVMKNGKSRTTMKKVLNQLRSDGHIVSLDYASWRDGYSSDGVRLEQCISRALYSPYTKEGNVLFSDSFGVSYSGDYETILEKERDSILLDTIRGRIYIRGTKLTSKDIHSQNTTIDMLKLLLENMGEEVSNSKLPISTYSQNKNEILGKVVLPIKKLSKEYFGKELSLTCSGGSSDYYLKLEHDESIRIGLIKKW